MKNHIVVNRNEADTEGFCNKCLSQVQLVKEKKNERAYCINRIKASGKNKREYDKKYQKNNTPYIFHKISDIENNFANCSVCGPTQVTLHRNKITCLFMLKRNVEIAKMANEQKSEEQKKRYRTVLAQKRGMKVECYQTEFDQLSNKQQGKCKICGREVKLVMDHDHETGAVRGLLCRQHNVGLGMFQDNPELLRLAAIYLENL